MAEGELDPIKSVRFRTSIRVISILIMIFVGTFLQLRWNYPVHGVSLPQSR
jgi:hypothetical protein